MIWQLLLALVVGLILRTYWISTKRMRSVRLVTPEEHAGKPIVMPYEDMTVTVFRFIKRILSGSTVSDYEFAPQLIQKWRNSIHSFQMAFFGFPMIVTWDPQIIREVACNTQQFGKISNVGLISEKLIGQGILMADGERWSKQRRVMNPAFKITKLKSIFPVFVETTHLLINALKNEIREGRSKLNPFPLLSKMTMEAIGKAGFGFDFGNFEKEPSLELTAYQFIQEKFSDPKYFFGFVAKLPTKENKKLEESFKSFNTLITDLIAKKRAQPQQEEEEKDLLQMMIAATEEGDKLTDEELIHNVSTLFIGGQETASSSLTSTLYLLAKNAEYQERMRNEAKEILHDRDPEYADMAKCPLINAVAKESLRIYPPLIGFSRMSKEDCVVNGYHVPKGTMFSLLSLAAHKSPEFFEDPEAFKPERWISSYENENKINKAWLPFGVGSRTCIGNHFTMLQMKCALAMLIREFKFNETSELKFRPSVALKPVDSFTVGFELLK
jgi:cytochrome P450